MSTQTISGRQAPTSEFVLIDPSTGGNLGTAANPLQTATSALQTTPDLTRSRQQITTATTTAVVAAGGGSLKCRVYRLRINVAGAQNIEIRDGATALEILNFTGAGFLTYDFFTRPWYTTTANTALNFVTTQAVVTNLVIEYTLAA